jgi:hypothetical protein
MLIPKKDLPILPHTLYYLLATHSDDFLDYISTLSPYHVSHSIIDTTLIGHPNNIYVNLSKSIVISSLVKLKPFTRLGICRAPKGLLFDCNKLNISSRITSLILLRWLFHILKQVLVLPFKKILLINSFLLILLKTPYAILFTENAFLASSSSCFLYGNSYCVSTDLTYLAKYRLIVVEYFGAYKYFQPLWPENSKTSSFLLLKPLCP